MFDIPTVSEVVSSTGSEGVALATEFLPLVWLGIIITLAVVATVFVRKYVNAGIRSAAGMRNGRRRRRR